MKYLMLTCILFIGFSVKAQDADAYRAKETLLKIFDLSKAESDVQLAEYLVYRGEDKNRKWKDTYNPKDKNELARANVVRLKIQKRLLPYKYEFTKFTTEKESEGKWYIWQLTYNKEGKSKSMYFAFLKVNGKLALGDIDND